MSNEFELQQRALQKRIRVFYEQEEDGVWVLVPRDAGTVSDVTAHLVAKLELESEPKSIALFLRDEHSKEVKLLAGESSVIIRDGDSVAIRKKTQWSSKRRSEDFEEINASKKQKDGRPHTSIAVAPLRRTEAVYQESYQQASYALQPRRTESIDASRRPEHSHFMDRQRLQNSSYEYPTASSMFQPNARQSFERQGPSAPHHITSPIMKSRQPPQRDGNRPSNSVNPSTYSNNSTMLHASQALPSPPRVSHDGLSPTHPLSSNAQDSKTPNNGARQGRQRPGPASLQSGPVLRSSPMQKSAGVKSLNLQPSKGPSKFQPTPPPGEAPRQSVFGGKPISQPYENRNGIVPHRNATANKRQSFGGSNLGRNEVKRRNVGSQEKVLNESKDLKERPDVPKTNGPTKYGSGRDVTIPIPKKPSVVQAPAHVNVSRKEEQTRKNNAGIGNEGSRATPLKIATNNSQKRIETVLSSGIEGEDKLSGSKKEKDSNPDKSKAAKPVPSTKTSDEKQQITRQLPAKPAKSPVQAKAETRHGTTKSRNLSTPIAKTEKQTPDLKNEEIAKLVSDITDDGLIRNCQSGENGWSIIKIMKHKEENAQKKKKTVWIICRLNGTDGSSNRASNKGKFQIKLKLTKGEIKVVLPVEKNTIEFLKQAKESARQCMSSSASKKAVYLLDEKEIAALCDPDLKSKSGKLPSHISLNPGAIHSFSIGEEKCIEIAKVRNSIKCAKPVKAMVASSAPLASAVKKEKKQVERREKSNKNESTKKPTVVDMKSEQERKNSKEQQQSLKPAPVTGATKVEKVRPSEAHVKIVNPVATNIEETSQDVSTMTVALENGKLLNGSEPHASVIDKETDMFHESVKYKLALGGLLCQIAETMETLAANEILYLGTGGIRAQDSVYHFSS